MLLTLFLSSPTTILKTTSVHNIPCILSAVASRLWSPEVSCVAQSRYLKEELLLSEGGGQQQQRRGEGRLQVPNYHNSIMMSLMSACLMHASPLHQTPDPLIALQEPDWLVQSARQVQSAPGHQVSLQISSAYHSVLDLTLRNKNMSYMMQCLVVKSTGDTDIVLYNVQDNTRLVAPGHQSVEV